MPRFELTIEFGWYTETVQALSWTADAGALQYVALDHATVCLPWQQIKSVRVIEIDAASAKIRKK